MIGKNDLLIDYTQDYETYIQNLWLGIGDVRKLKIDNKMLRKEWDNPTRIPELIVKTCFDPDYLHFFIKYILNIDILPFQMAIQQVLWKRPLPMLIGSRGSSKSFMLAVYIICRMVLQQGCRVAVVGGALRQSMVIFNYIEQIWHNAPILRDICGNKNHPKKELHSATWKCGFSIAHFLPLGTGETIRGMRANVVVGDEFASIDKAIFETVVRGFAAVKSGGVFDSVVQAAKSREMIDTGIIDKDQQYIVQLPHILNNNQIILSGTASYQFNHFYQYYQLYKAIMIHGNDPKYLKQNFPDLILPEDCSPQNYAIIRLPYDCLPPGMMDKSVLDQGRATMDPNIFNMEYLSVFPADSQGFYLASVLNAATCPLQSNGQTITAYPKLVGDKDKIYIMGIDPASEADNFAISIIEINDGYRALVYTWSTNHKKFEELKRLNQIHPDINDYHTFCIKHIRSLMQRFRVELVVCDKAGGGVNIREGLRDADKMDVGDVAILDMDDENTCREKGRRILKLAEFSSASWRTDSHYGLKKDLQEKMLLFPEYDAAQIELENLNRGDQYFYETLENCHLEILECKTEITFIKHSQTPNGTEKWDVPEVVGLSSDQTKKKLKKDRFTSLLLANWGARNMSQLTPTPAQSWGHLVKRSPTAHSVSVPKAGVRFSNGPGGRKIFY